MKKLRQGTITAVITKTADGHNEKTPVKKCAEQIVRKNSEMFVNMNLRRSSVGLASDWNVKCRCPKKAGNKDAINPKAAAAGVSNSATRRIDSLTMTKISAVLAPTKQYMKIWRATSRRFRVFKAVLFPSAASTVAPT